MFKRFRQLEISLAAKCQLLFGAAVILIIGAALYVPWQRMTQLMEQMNERTARALADWAQADHVARQMAAKAGNQPATQRAATLPDSVNLAPSVLRSQERASIRLLLWNHEPRDMTRFDRTALESFREKPLASSMARLQEHKEGPASYRFARALRALPSCIECHKADLPPQQSGEQPAGALPLLGIVSIEIPYQAEENQVLINRLFIFMAGLVAGTLAVIVFYLITTRLILGPVRVLRETAEKVSKGDLNIRSDISTGDEFQKLSETFNRMLANLKQGEDQLRAINKNLDMKLGELEESNLALYESNRLKSEFLANVSHELRTPLNSILGFAELLKDSLAEDPKASRYVHNICTSGKNLLDLINDLLDLAKIEAGRMEVRSAPLSLSDLFEGLVTIMKPMAEKKELSIVAAVDSDVPILQTDAAKLQQVLYNFLSNAIKFSPGRGRIDVRAQRTDEEHVRITVADQGPGVAPDKQSLIFEKFRQIDGSTTREHGGSGLGLAISKDLTVLLGGTIGLQSKPGEGATFFVILPIRIEAGAQNVIVAHQN